VQSQTLRTWRLGLPTSHEVPIYLRSIHAILAIESMEVGTYHFTRGLESLEVDCAILTVESMEVGTYHFTRGPKS
jgi:hypothetical protein